MVRWGALDEAGGAAGVVGGGLGMAAGSMGMAAGRMGGAGALADFPPAIEAGADAVLAASVFHFGELKITDVKSTLRAAGHPVR